MDWVAIITLVNLFGGLILSLLLIAFCIGVGASLRKRLDDAMARQSAAYRTLADGHATLQRQLQEARTQIQRLAESNRHLSDELDALGERVGDAGPRPGNGRPRLLN